MFCKNTGMNEKQQKLFFKVLDDVASDAWKNPDATVESVNAEITKVLAYHSYFDDPLEKQVIDFSTVHPIVHDEEVIELFKKLHNFRYYLIDTPHQGATLGSSYTGSFKNEVVKYIGSLSFSCGIAPWTCGPYLLASPFVYDDVFWMLNSFVGDWLTTNSAKDEASNTDAYIMKYHPKYQGMTVNNIYRDLYRKHDLNGGARDELYSQAKGGIGSSIYHYGIIGLALTSAAALALVTLIPAVKYISEKVFPIVKTLAINIFETTKKAISIIRNKGIVPVLKKGVSVIKDRVVKPVVNFVNNKIIKPVKNFVKNKVVKPIVKTVKKAVRAIKNKVVKPVVRFVKNKIVTPVKNFFKKIFSPQKSKHKSVTRKRNTKTKHKNVKKGRR